MGHSVGKWDTTVGKWDTTGCPKKCNNIVLIAMGEPNVLQKIYNHLEKDENVSLFQMVEYFL